MARRLLSHPWLDRVVFPTMLLVGYFVLPSNEDDAPVGVLVGLLLGFAAVGTVAFLVFREALRSERRLQVIHLVLALEVVLVVFSFAYYLLSLNHTDEMVGIQTRLDALYFSATLVSTVGFGDIHASGQFARGLVTLNIVFNLAFVASLVNLIRDRISSGMVEPDRGRHAAKK